VRKIIITDLTRFSNREIVCVAGIDIESGSCIRPMPYLKFERCKELNMLPGAILTGEFVPTPNIVSPHVEDMDYKKLSFQGHCSATEFLNILRNSCFPSVEEGFDCELEKGQKHIPLETNLCRSIITIRLDPNNITVIQDSFNEKKIKIHFIDGAGKEFSFISITDLGFHNYAEKNYHEANGYLDINMFFKEQTEIFIRVGLSRYYKAPNGREGYWIQVNGIYTFPNFDTSIRSYE
jgi:hypothetical protein